MEIWAEVTCSIKTGEVVEQDFNVFVGQKSDGW